MSSKNGELERLARTIAAGVKDGTWEIEKALLAGMRGAIDLERAEIRRMIDKISDRSGGDPSETGHAWRGCAAAIDGEIASR